jgi:hypothetical protein
VNAPITVLDDFRLTQIKDPTERRRRELRMGYLTCFPTVISQILDVYGKRLPEYPIEFVFDDQKGLEGEALDTFREVRDQLLRPEFREFVATPIFRPSHQVKPIQAADLLAYETQKKVFNDRFDPQRDYRKSLMRLVLGRAHIAKYFDWPSVQAALLRVSEKGEFKPYPSAYDSDAWSRAVMALRDRERVSGDGA